MTVAEREGGIEIRVKWVETWRDGSTSRDRSVAPRQPLPDPLWDEHGEGGRPVSISLLSMLHEVENRRPGIRFGPGIENSAASNPLLQEHLDDTFISHGRASLDEFWNYSIGFWGLGRRDLAFPGDCISLNMIDLGRTKFLDKI